MAFAGGVYTLPAGNPVVTATTIQSSWANTTLSDIATALSTCILKDGTQTLTANIPMAGFKLTGLGAGSAVNDSVRMVQVQLGSIIYLTGTAGTNTVTAAASPPLTSLATGQTFRFIPAATNTGATTLQIDSTAATNVFSNGAALLGNELKQNIPVEVFFDGTQYQIIGSAGVLSANAVVDSVFRINAAGDQTKRFAVSVTGVAAGVTVTMAAPATGGSTFVGDTLIQTLTNKTLTSPTINTLVTGSAVAVKADMSGGTAANLIVSPSQMVNSKSSAKAWGSVGSPTTVQNSFPSGAVVSNSSGGFFQVVFAATMANTSYSVNAQTLDPLTPYSSCIVARNSGNFSILFITATGGATFQNPTGFTYTVYGDLV